jgi:hypothetical protein
MTHNKHPQFGAESEQDETGFILRMIWIMLQSRILVGKNCCGFFKGDTVFDEICRGFCLVPRKSRSIHNAIIFLMALCSKGNILECKDTHFLFQRLE